MLYRNVEHQLVGVQRISGMAQETVVPDALIWSCPQRLGAPDFQPSVAPPEGFFLQFCMSAP